MKHLVSAAVVVAVLSLGYGRAEALNALVSEPVKGGAGGLVCSCMNLGKEAVTVVFSLRGTGINSCVPLSIAAGFVRSCTIAVTDARSCQVRRQDDKAPSTKQFRCTLSALDAAGNPTVVVPVDRRFKQ